MREILFRAWAKHTVNNELQYAMDETKKKYNPIEPNNHYTEEWDTWYDDKNRYYEEMRAKWKSEHGKTDEYTETFEMITDISVNGRVTRPYGYEIIDVMQFTGLCDKNGKKIFEGDIVRNGYSSNLGEFWDSGNVVYVSTDGCFEICNTGEQYLKRLTQTQIVKRNIEVIGTIHDKESD